MEKNELKTNYENYLPRYRRAAANLREALSLFLDEQAIPYLAILARVKEFESFFEKTVAKNYSDPFLENTDFVGLRVVLYFPKDIVRVADVIQTEFDVIESEDKADQFDVNEFGYRSHHMLVRVKSEWLSTPNYRGLDGITIEIQVRTVLMHAWAEIEHKLQYKSKEQVPRELQRKLFLLSAKFEEADGQFQDLKGDIDHYRQAIAEKVEQAGAFDPALELNLDTLKELLRFFYPNHPQHDGIANNVFNKIEKRGLALADLIDAVEHLKPFEQELQRKVSSTLAAAAMLGYALEIFVPGYWDSAKCSKSRNRIISEMRSIVMKH